MSNLLQKASIVTTPTAYGVGVLNSIKPAIPFGEELISNGSFNNGSTGWTIINGTVTDKYNASMTAYQSGIRIVPFSYTGTFKVVFDLVITSGNCKFDAGGGNDEIYTTSGTKEKIITNPTKFEFNAFNLGWVGTLDNVSVKEMIDADFDFTRTSSATRVNPDYLLETVSINSADLVQNGNFSQLGSELVTNGDFATDTNWTKGTGWSISNGKAVGSNSSSSLYQATGSNYTSGKTYKIVFTVSDYVSGSVRPEITNVAGDYVTSNGTFTQYIVATSSAIGEELKGALFTGSIDNVSVKQVDPNDDWVVGTGWSYGTNKIIHSSGTGSASRLKQLGFNNTSVYKLTITITNKGINTYRIFNGAGSTVSLLEGTNTYLVTGFLAGQLIIEPNFHSGGDVEFSNISVIEIQENGVPRLDYTNGTASILLEPQSTNLIQYSEDLSDSYWSKTRASITDNSLISPDGNYNADKFTQITSTAWGGIVLTVSPSGTSTLSVFAKKIDNDYIAIIGHNSNDTKVYFNLNNGTIGTVGSDVTSSDIQDYGNGWYRCILTASVVNRFTVLHATADNGNTADLNTETSLWGAQLEEKSYATSYIPTDGSSITRAAETLNNAGNSDLINSTEGVLYVEIAALADDGTYRILSLSNGTSDERIYIQYTNVSNTIAAVVKNGGVTQANRSFVLSDETQFNKIAFKYKANDFALWINGVQVGTDTNGSTPIGLSELAFDNGAGGNDFYGRCKTVAVFKEALSDTELACLTSTNNREIFLNYYYRMQYVEANTEALSCAEQTFNV